jgi:7,8-dihydroneopterin aldolase/epimerase/oxygenase
MSTISIEGMEFFAYHGCFPEEKIIGTRFILDLFLETNTDEAEKSDNLNNTVNYLEVYKIVKKQMEIKSNLLEHVGRRIIDEVKNFFPQVISVEIKVRKMNPPLGGKMDFVSVTMRG